MEKREPIGRAVASIPRVNGTKVEYENVDLGAVWPAGSEGRGFSFTMLSMPLAWHNTSTPRKVTIWLNGKKEGIEIPTDQFDDADDIGF